MEVSRSSEKIDMTLDEIIELNKKEQKATSGAQRTKKRMMNRYSILKKLGKEGQQCFPFRRWAYGIQQGPYRPRFIGPYRQGFYRKRPNNFKRDPPSANGVSPLNRKPWDTKAQDTEPLRQPKVKPQPWFNRKLYQPYRHPVWPMRRTPQPYRRKFQQFGQNQGQGTTRPFTLNRTFLARKVNDRFAMYQKVRRERKANRWSPCFDVSELFWWHEKDLHNNWRNMPSSGSILTVSLSNTTTAPDPLSKVKQSTLTDVSPETGEAVAQPKGIPLRFNFKAVANQTGVSLNDRFTGMKIRGGTGYRPWRGRGRGRTVTLQ